MAINNIKEKKTPIKAYLKADPFSQQFVMHNEQGESKELVTNEMFWGENKDNSLYLDYSLIRNRKIEVLEGISQKNGSQTLLEEECDNWLQKNIFNLDESKVFVIQGYAGCGKTTLMNKLLRHRKIDEDAFYVDIGKDWAYPLESSMFFNESLNAFDKYMEYVIKATSRRERIWEKFIEMCSDVNIQKFDMQISNIIAQLIDRKERLGWNKLRINIRGYLFEIFGNKNDNPRNSFTEDNKSAWHNCGQTQTVISLLILMICADFLVKNEKGITRKSYFLIFDNLDVITDPALSAENVLTLWGIMHRFMEYKSWYKSENKQDLPDFGLLITVRKVLYSYITSYLPDLEMGLDYNSYYINVCDISDLYLSQDILKHRIAFWTKYIDDKETINKLNQLGEITSIHAKSSLLEYEDSSNFEDIFEIPSSINLDAFFNHNYRALSNVLSVFLEDKKYTQSFLQDFNSRAHSKNWQKVATLVFDISLLYKNGNVWGKMGFGCEDFSLIDFPTTLNRLILNYLYIARCGQVLYSYKNNRRNIPIDERVSLRNIIRMFEKVKFISIDRKYNEEQINRRYVSAEPLVTRTLIIERLADMCARNAKVYNSCAYGYDTDIDELWRRPLYFVDGVKMNHTAATDKELKLYFEEVLNKGKDDQVFFSITDEGFVLIQDIVASFEFYSARYCKSFNPKPLHQANTKQELERLIIPVYDAVKLCCERHRIFMEHYIKQYNIDIDKYLSRNFHPRTKPRFVRQTSKEKKLTKFSFRPQLHIVRVIYMHISYFNNIKELFSKSYSKRKKSMCKCLTEWIENYLELYQEYFFDLLEDTVCHSDNNVYNTLAKLLEEQKGHYLNSGDEINVNIGKKDRDDSGNMGNNRMVINMNGGQFNLAKDNATINATQNNGVNGNELDNIIKGIMENLSDLKNEDADKIADIVEMAKAELVKSEPKISRLRNCLTLIAPMFTIANGIPTLAANLQKLQELINLYIH